MKNRRHDGTHGDDCFGCRIQTIQMAPSATPSRVNNVPPRTPDPAWERGRAGETRRDGSFMPYLTSDFKPIGVKQMQEKRAIYEGARHRQLAETPNA